MKIQTFSERKSVRVYDLRPFLTAILTAPILLLSACAGLAADKTSGIGPYHQITARIMVMQPKHVWQAMMNWQAKQPNKGKIRIVHAVSSRIVEFRWQHDEIWLRDNQAENPIWRLTSKEELASNGIVITPQELSEFLAGHIPSGFQPKGSNRWIVDRSNSHVRVEWNAQKKRLIFSDIKHGRKATLIILKSA